MRDRNDNKVVNTVQKQGWCMLNSNNLSLLLSSVSWLSFLNGLLDPLQTLSTHVAPRYNSDLLWECMLFIFLRKFHGGTDTISSKRAAPRIHFKCQYNSSILTILVDFLGQGRHHVSPQRWGQALYWIPILFCAFHRRCSICTSTCVSFHVCVSSRNRSSFETSSHGEEEGQKQLQSIQNLEDPLRRKYTQSQPWVQAHLLQRDWTT